jgi:hypothetical protein
MELEEKKLKPVWVCSEDPPSHSQFIRRAEAKVRVTTRKLRHYKRSIFI